MTEQLAGEVCEQLNTSLRGSELNLSVVANTMVVVLRDQAWRRRVVRTGEIVECDSFLELLTAPPLKGFGEDPKRVETLLRDDAEALQMFRAATTAPHGGDRTKSKSDIVTLAPKRGNARAYALDRLKRKAPDLYKRVVAQELSAHAAAKAAGLIREKSPLEHLRHWWRKATADERRDFLRGARLRQPLGDDEWAYTSDRDRCGRRTTASAAPGRRR
jgi:hypothetical protein